MRVILSGQQFKDSIATLAAQLVANHTDLDDVVFVGIQQGGVAIANAIVTVLQEQKGNATVQNGQLDITFYRDDIRNTIIAPDKMHIPFAIENKTVVLIDDVLFTGRTIKAALDALLDYGRPAKIELCVLIDRKEHRQFPIQADYTGKVVETLKTEKVKMIDGEVVVL